MVLLRGLVAEHKHNRYALVASSLPCGTAAGTRPAAALEALHQLEKWSP